MYLHVCVCTISLGCTISQQIPEPSQLALLHAEEQWLSFKILSGYQVPHPIMKSEPSYRLKETHIGLLYLQYSYSHDPEFMDFGEDQP